MTEQQVKPYDAKGSKKGQVSKMFDNIAPYYDFLNHFLSLGIDNLWRKKAVAQLKGTDARLILDVATGTGDLAFEINKQLKPDRVVGVDISEEMLAFGRKKVAKRGLTDKISLQTGDSEHLPFADASFDAVTAAFGVRNFENLEKGLAEMRRVLKPNGTLVVLEFSRPRVFPFKQLFNFYFKNILPMVGRFTSKDKRAYSYLYESVQAFPDGADFVKVLEKLDYKSSQCIPLSLGICSIYIGKK